MDSRSPDERLTKLDGLHVLVVDDDVDALDLLAAVLETRAAHVVCAGSASEAMLRMQESKPDVLISDIGMPGEDGYSLIRRIRSLPEQQGGTTPAIALTAFNQESDRRRALAAGFSGHLSKPVDLQLLCSEIERLWCSEGNVERPIEQLRSATRALHERIEQQPYAQRVMDGRVSRVEYGAFLQSMYLLQRELEAALDRATEPALHEVFRDDMRKVAWLVQDVRELGLSSLPAGAMAQHAEQLAARYHAVCESDPFWLLGALYVLEGASIGGRVQRAALIKRSEFAQLGHHYLSGYDSGTRRHFERFLQRLGAALSSTARADSATQGAVATFETMGKILDAILPDDSVRSAAGTMAFAAPGAREAH